MPLRVSISSSSQKNLGSISVHPTAKIRVPISTTKFEWQQQGSVPERNCFQSGTAPNSSHVLWKKWFLAILHPPIVVNGKVIGAANLRGMVEEPSGFLYALDQNTGDIIWTTNMTDPLYSGWPYGNHLMKINERHFMYIHEGQFTIYDIENGRLLLNFNAGNYLGAPGVYVPELKKWFGLGSWTKVLGQTVEAWDFSNALEPKMSWRSEPIEQVDPRLHYENGRIHIGSYDYAEYCFDAETGKILWQQDMKGLTSYYGAAAYGKIFRGSINNYLWALDPTTGETLWEFRPSIHGYDKGFSGCIVAAYGKVYMRNTDGYLYAVDANNGTLAWKYRAFEPNATQPIASQNANKYGAAADGKVYWLVADRSIRIPNVGSPIFVCLDAETGKEIWRSYLAEMRCPAIADGRLYGQDWIYDRGVFTTDWKIANETGAYLWCFGRGPLTLKIGTDTHDIYELRYITHGGKTSIIGNTTDLSPANLGAPAKNVPIKISWRLPDGTTGEIGTTHTDETGELFYKWTPPATGTYTIIAESAGNDAYDAHPTTTTTLIVNPASGPPIIETASTAIVIIAIALLIIYLHRRRTR